MRFTITVTAAVTAAALALAGCHAASDQATGNAADNSADLAGNASNAAEPTNATAAVLALPEAQRDGVFLRAINDAGLSCQAITKAERLPDDNGKPNWRATCSDGSAHLIDISPDGTAVITSRTTP